MEAPPIWICQTATDWGGAEKSLLITSVLSDQTKKITEILCFALFQEQMTLSKEQSFLRTKAYFLLPSLSSAHSKKITLILTETNKLAAD